MNLIPLPKKYTEYDGVYTLGAKINSVFALPLVADFLTDAPSSFQILKEESVSKEGYRLRVTPKQLIIQASTEIGAYYALQSVRRLSGYDVGGKEVPCCEIEDEPRFRWRGLQLDESRHFFGENEVKRFLDFMFAEKLNVLHWHLTDDQGWRIEIKKYPLLTQIGSKRKYTQTGGWDSFRCSHKPVGGFYSQNQIRDIVRYAAQRGITVVPEIDFPAHCASAMAAYPFLACFEKKTEVPGYFGGLIPQAKRLNFRWNRTLCCGKKSTFDFVFGVLDEVCGLFPSKYLHIGGDEAPHGEWKRCPLCQGVMKENSLKNETALQGWFENKVIAYLKTKGKTPVGWNEVIRSENLNHENNALVLQYWTRKRDKFAEAYVNSGGAALLSNHQAFYFDMPYALYPLSNTYCYKPEHYGVNKDNMQNVLGVEGELWSEWIPNREKLDLSAFPRLQALSEVAWSPEEKRDFDDFKRRLNALKPSLEKLEIGYAKDKIAMNPDDRLRRRIKRKFRKGDPLLEVKLNRN